MDNSEFTIIIRTSDQKHADERVAFNPELTVGDLKQKLQLDHPGSPDVQKQRLIHGGKVLSDAQQIKSILKESNAIIHLVWSPENPSPPTNTGTTSTPVSPPVGFRHRHVTPTGPVHTSTPMYAAPPFAYDAEAYAQWWAQYQQQYAYMMQYYATPTQHGHPATAEPAQDGGVAENPQPAPNAQDVRQNVGGGVMEVADDDNEGRDWLDVLFAMTRFGLLLSVIYFYSSTYRFVATLVVLFLIYLYQAGVFQVNRIPGRAPERNVDQQPRQQQPDLDDNNNRSDDEVTETPQNIDPAPGIFATAWCFVRSFFSSLVPTGPPAMVN